VHAVLQGRMLNRGTRATGREAHMPWGNALLWGILLGVLLIALKVYGVIT